MEILKIKDWLIKSKPQFQFMGATRSFVKRNDGIIFSLRFIDCGPYGFLFKQFHDDLIHVSVEILYKDKSIAEDKRVIEINRISKALASPITHEQNLGRTNRERQED